MAFAGFSGRLAAAMDIVLAFITFGIAARELQNRGFLQVLGFAFGLPGISFDNFRVFIIY